MNSACQHALIALYVSGMETLMPLPSGLVYILQVAPELQTNAPFSHIQFSADGKLMLCVAEGHIHQLDAFNGALLQSFDTGVPQGSMGLGAIFSPDSNYILSGQICWLHLIDMCATPAICRHTCLQFNGQASVEASAT